MVSQDLMEPGMENVAGVGPETGEQTGEYFHGLPKGEK